MAWPPADNRWRGLAPARWGTLRLVRQGCPVPLIAASVLPGATAAGSLLAAAGLGLAGAPLGGLLSIVWVHARPPSWRCDE